MQGRYKSIAAQIPNDTGCRMLRLCLLLVAFVSSSFSQFTFPVPVIEALRPKGFRITIRDRPDIELFGFHGKINEEISSNTLGDISADVKRENGKLIYYDPDLQLKVGDTLNYWLYVQANQAGYVQADKKWEVKELVSFNNVAACGDTSTISSFTDKRLCAGSVFFEDDFNGGEIDRNLWTVEQYIAPYIEGNFEYVSYEDVNECRFLSNSNLFLKPVVRDNIRGKLDFTGKCTRKAGLACSFEQFGASILPPIKSAKITSKMSFRYGKVEIRAKLPLGDWIYPQIELIPEDSAANYPKILMAYARGNEKLTLPNTYDIGSQLLFGGYINSTSSKEPERTAALKNTHSTSPIGQDMHVFTVIWKPEKIEFMLDNRVYGQVNDVYTPEKFRISLGVGVGGVIDFPDNTRSGSFKKPWSNVDAKQMKKFTDAKSNWISTWHENNVALQVDYVRVSAV